MPDWIPTQVWECLFLLVVVNGAPIVARKLDSSRYGDWPVDCGWQLADGQPLLGKTKTWRGLVAGMVAGVALSPLLSLSWYTCLVFAGLSLGGDLVSSFIKRRLRLRPSARALGLDQLLEALLPLWYIQRTQGLDTLWLWISVFVFLVLELTLSRLLYRLQIRNRPY